MTSSPTTPMRTLVARLGVFALAITGLALIPTTTASAQPVTVTTATELETAFNDGDDVVLGADITIDETGPDIAVADGADITLDLNGWILDVTNDDNDPAIRLRENTGLTIDDTAGGGELHATAQGFGAGIGTGIQGTGGNIIINGGTITATAQGFGAGIGTGLQGTGGDITINGGDITATSNDGAGIGTGTQGPGGNIIINGGDITATSNDGAGIGTGTQGTGGDITITGGDITATSNDGAGIGTGLQGTGGDITINGGDITATSNFSGAGIGTGYQGDGGIITITGGNITATSTDGAGIGTGLTTFNGDGADITIGVDAVVEASSDDASAVGPGVGGQFGSLSNAGTLILPADSHIEVPDGIVVANSGLIRGDGQLRGDGEIDNSGAIWHSVDVDVDVTDHDYELDFDPNGGTGGPTDTIRVYAATLADAGLSVPTDEPTRSGSAFTGWFDAATGGTGPLDDTSVLSDQSADRDAPVPVTWFADWFGPEIDTTNLPDGQIDQDYDAILEGSGGSGDLTWSITAGALPDGLDLDPDTGAITGTPTEDGTFDVTVTATDEDGNTDTADLTITIEPADETPGNGEDPPTDGPSDEEPPAAGGSQPPPTGGQPLPRTGAPIAPMTAAGLSAITLGALLLGTRRRRGLT